MKKMYLITVPAENPQEKPYLFVTEDIAKITGKYPFFMIQRIDVV